MSLSFVDSTVVEPSGSTTPITVGVPAGAAVDDLLLLVGAYNNNSVAATPAGWNVWHTDSTTALGLVVFWRIATSGDVAGGVTYSIANTASRSCGAMLAYRGADATTPEDVASSNNTGNGTQTFPAITPATAGAWIIAIGAHITAAGDASVTWSTSNMDAVDEQALGSTSGVTDATLGVAHEAWTSGAFTPNLTSTGTTGRSISISSAIRPATATTPSGGSTVDVAVSVAGSGSKRATGGSTVDVGISTAGTGEKHSTGGSSVSVTVSTSGTGSKRATSGSSSSVDASTDGSGTKESTGGSSVDVGVTTSSGGEKRSTGGSGVAVSVSVAGTGEKRATGGSTVDVDVTTSGSGTNPGGPAQGGSRVDVAVSTSGTGSKRATGGSTASVSVTTTGSGSKSTTGGANVSVAVTTAATGSKRGVGGSDVDVDASVTGSGTKLGSNGSVVDVAITVTGSGSNPDDRDRDVHVVATIRARVVRAEISPRTTYAAQLAPSDLAAGVAPSTFTAELDPTEWRAIVSTATRQVYVGTTEYLVVNVSANVDLGDQTVTISLDGTTFAAASWVGSTASPRRAARLLLDDANTPAAGEHDVFVKIDDGVEIPVIRAGTIVVIDPTA